MQTVRSEAEAARNVLWDAVGSQLTLAALGGSPPIAGGRWAIEGVIGRGGFGLVCAARDLKLQRKVAIKLLPHGPEISTLLREARSLARLEHPSIVTVFEIEDGVVVCGERSLPCGWIAMQLVDGETLDVWLQRRARRTSAIVGVLVEAGRALAHAHKGGILHRDLKPANIMVDGSGRAHVIDFGLAIAAATDGEARAGGHLADELGTRGTGPGLLRGTPGYMAPEAVSGRPSAQSDQFALAIVAWEALKGSHPVPGAPLTPHHGKTKARTWARVEPVLRRAMSTIPSERFPTVDDFCDALSGATSRKAGPITVIAGASVVGLSIIGASTVLDDLGASSSNDAGVQTPKTVVVPATCEGLDAWEGQWNVTTKVVWTEYSDQLERIRPMRLGLTVDETCDAKIAMERFQPADRRGGDTLLTQSITTRPEQLANGDWSMSFDIAFPGDRQTYDHPEGYRLSLVLDRASDDEPRMHGAFDKHQTDTGMVLRSGWVLGRRESTPTLADVDAQDRSCHARCFVSCAGPTARAECVERECRPYAEPLADPCGPPSTDFVTPLRAKAERNHFRKGKPFGAVRGGSNKDCQDNAKLVAGPWWVWRNTTPEPQRIRLDVVPEGCGLRATATIGEEVTHLTGQMTPRGVWYLAQEGASPLEPETLILVGTGPAFGIDMGDRALRAFKP